MMQEGNLRIPKFQREFVWTWQKSAKLLESISRNFPIGTFFLWHAPKEFNNLIRELQGLEQPNIDMENEHLLILDGQQRLSALYAIFYGCNVQVSKGNRKHKEDYSKFAVDLLEVVKGGNPFLLHDGVIDNQRWVSVRDLFSPERQGIYRNIEDTSYQTAYHSIYEALSVYPLSVVKIDVREKSEEEQLRDAIDVFERINQEGLKLDKFDQVAANVYDHKHNFDLRIRVDEDIMKPLKRMKFGVVSRNIIPPTLAMNVNLEDLKMNFRDQLDMETEKVVDCWKRTAESIVEAVKFVREYLGVARNDFLPYDHFLPIIAHYFYLNKTCNRRSSKKKEAQLKKWFWQATFEERFTHGVPGKLAEDAKSIRNFVMKGEKIPTRHISHDTHRIMEIRINQNKAALRRGILCMLNLIGPKEFEYGQPIKLPGSEISDLNKSDKHHIFPVAFLKSQRGQKRSIHSMPNFCFIPSKLNQLINKKAPSEYLAEYREKHPPEIFEDIMATHLLPVSEDSPVWSDDYNRFIEKRATMLLTKARELAGVD
ncbi:MAG: DUF262 domain-containing protein [Chloroflexi bacterium]|nr:DUF262 domain-containing protein [Chloroflexota bacterium]